MTRQHAHSPQQRPHIHFDLLSLRNECLSLLRTPSQNPVVVFLPDRQPIGIEWILAKIEPSD
jgi:hypothetical protein